MSSSEPSGTPAEGTATPPAPAAEFPSFGSTRGSGLARGKRPAASAAASASPSATAYMPTAIEVVHAPREYTNPFAPAEAAPAAPAPIEHAIETPKSESSIPPAAVGSPAPVTPEATPTRVPAPAPEPMAQLNILPPAEQKSVPAQTWESDGFTSPREARRERPQREESRREEPRRDEPRREESRRDESADEPVDIASIPEKFLYVRPGVTYVPTPRNWGGAPRDRAPRPSADSGPRREASFREEPSRVVDSQPTATVAAKPAGIFGWLKSLFSGDAPAPEPVAVAPSESFRRDGPGGERRHRGGRGRGPGGEGNGGGGGGGQRRRGGRGRGPRPGEGGGSAS